ncbi:PRR7 protein, partial [Polyodon spathula]|nr:PRR7 protein [Polyodon spathula]
MGMSQGTYTFLTCFAGFWLIWALIVLLCCLCSYMQRRVKRRREERLRELTLRTLEMDALAYRGYPHREPPGAWENVHGSIKRCHQLTIVVLFAFLCLPAEVIGKPPCYEEAVMMEDPPPPYTQVLADTRGGVYTKAAAGGFRKHQDPETNKPLPEPVLTEHPYTSSIHQPGAGQWNSLGTLLSTADLNRTDLPAESTGALPAAFPVIGRSTAV